MGQSLTLVDQGGKKIPRFGAAGVKKAIMDPVKCSSESTHRDYAMVYCEEAQTFIMREGYKSRSYEITLIYWDSADEDAQPKSETYEAADRDKAIAKFLRLCKRNPLYADSPA